MASPLSADHLKNLKLFIDVCKKDANILHHPDLNFFKNYIESLGGVVPPKKSKESKENIETEVKDEKTKPDVEDVESEESEVELDYEGVIGNYIFFFNNNIIILF